MRMKLIFHMNTERRGRFKYYRSGRFYSLILIVTYGIRFWTVMMWRIRIFLITEESGITYSEEIKLAIGSYLYPKAI